MDDIRRPEPLKSRTWMPPTRAKIFSVWLTYHPLVNQQQAFGTRAFGGAVSVVQGMYGVHGSPPVAMKNQMVEVRDSCC
jgi:hypothetical protein